MACRSGYCLLVDELKLLEVRVETSGISVPFPQATTEDEAVSS